jgi:hypothetical protein
MRQQGTVFVHAIANLQSTYATGARLTISGTKNMTLAETTGEYTRKEKQILNGGQQGGFHHTLDIPLGNLQYGQSREIFLVYGQDIDPSSEVYVGLEFNPESGERTTLRTSRHIQQTTTTLLPQEIAYHTLRAQICFFLSSLAPLNNEQHQHLPARELPSKRAELAALIASMASLSYLDEPNQSLLTDLAGADPAGQISLAISTDIFYNRWGKHYLLSLQNAYAKQTCNSFKDAGPLQFGKDSPLFIYCRDKLDRAFDSLPAPKPSGILKGVSSSPTDSRPIAMSSYHRRGNPCFAGDCTVKLGERKASIPLRDLTPGTILWTPTGNRKVAQIVRTSVRKYEMCVLGMCRITPYHPVFVDGQWVFPSDIAEKKTLYTGMIYSLLLEEDGNVDAHAIEVGGVVAVTLGHGLINKTNGGDTRAHPFLGNYKKVAESLAKLPIGLGGVLVSRGMTRDLTTGLGCGFLGKKDAIKEMGSVEVDNCIAVKEE